VGAIDADEGAMSPLLLRTTDMRLDSRAYQWRRCDASGASCAATSGATSSGYTLASGEVGATVQVAVTAANAGGSATATSAPSGIVQSVPAPPTQTSTFSGSLSPKSSSLSYPVTVGAGFADARLSFNSSKCGSLTLALRQGVTTLASGTGPSVLLLDRTLSAGSYTYVVSGSRRCGFTLAVTSAGT
jgi:hypothetical protein